jgi:60 kDa SS-A/Ro ribonucleoprotein
MSNYAELLQNAETPQTKPLKGRKSEMAKNYAGGYTFTIDKWKQLERFLILGSDSPTYYASAPTLTLENSQVVLACAADDAALTAAVIKAISVAGRGVKNDTCIFALALMAAMGGPDARKWAFNVVNDVCRIGTHV